MEESNILSIAAGDRTTRVAVIKKEGTSIQEALDQAEKLLGSSNVILIQEAVRNLDSKTILDHENFYYIANYQ